MMTNLKLTIEGLPRERLMIPGPVEVDDDVLSAMGSHVPVHYGVQWTALYKAVTEKLRQVFQTDGDVFLLVSSGSGGLEAAVSSMFAPGESIVVASNGFFGDRLASIAQLRGLDVLKVTSPWGKPVSVEAVRAVIESKRGIAGLAAVHVETSTGVLNPIRELGALSEEFNLPFVVDAVSSLGGEDLAMADWGIDVCVGATQKCLEAPPGLAPVAVSPRAWKVMDRKTNPCAGWYLNLRIWRQFAEEWGEWHPYPITMATNLVLALAVALDRLMAEGVSARIRRYREAAQFFRSGVLKLGFSLYIGGETAASTVTAVRRLPGMDVSGLLLSLQENRNIHIAGGLGETKGEIFRVGHMGKAASHEYTASLLEGIASFLE